MLSPSLLAILCLMQPRIPLAFFVARAWCPPCVQQEPQVLFCQAAFVVPSRVHRAVAPQVPDFVLFLLNFMRFLSACFSSPSNTLWVATQHSGVSATPPVLCHLQNLLSIHSAPLSRLLMRMLNRAKPRYQ